MNVEGASPETPVLALESVQVPAPGGTTGPRIDLRLAPGELALVDAPRGPFPAALLAVAVGLVPPAAGTVRFDGEDWRELRPTQAARLRHRIGRVFGDTEWISNLNVDENVILGACHHTHRPEREIVAEALELATRFGLDELTSLRPNRVRHEELRAYALVRAFLGAPRLLILERPLRGLRRGDLLAPLGEELAAARARGAAALWFTSDATAFESDETRPDARYVLRGQELRQLEGESA